MLIDFKVDNLESRVQDIITNAKQKIELAERGTTWDEVFAPLDEIDNVLGKETCVQSHLNSVCFDEEFNAQYEKTLPLISNFYSELGTNVELYEAFQRLSNTSLDNTQKYILENVLRDFKLSGVHLSAKKQEQYRELSSRLSLLSNDFAKNSLQATNAFTKIVTKEELQGLSDNDLEKLKEGDEYVLSLQIPQYLAVMTYCDDRSIRKELYLAFVARASEIDNFDNAGIMQEILDLRLELAHLLGFENYAQYSLATKMIEKPSQVEEFLDELITKSRPQAERELQELQQFAGRDLQPWDLSYYSEKQKIQNYGFSKSEIAKYFPFTTVLDGLLELIAELYNLKYEVQKEETYHVDVLTINLFEGDTCIGKIYIDPFARKNKRGGAWMNDYQGLNTTQIPVAFVVCNASAPTANTPSLFEFDDVVTLFHEFGHALHHVLTKVSHPSVAGISGVPWDGVELPSQYMEFFAYEHAVIQKISGHYQTSQPLPDELFEKLIESKNYNSGLAMLRQCEFALWDIKTHQTTQNTYEVLEEVRKKTALLESVAENRFLNTFGHIFSGGYAAGYYSYKWAEVLAADAYEIVSKDKQKTNDFRECILATGGSGDFMQNYIKFSTREPKINALLRACGIK